MSIVAPSDRPSSRTHGRPSVADWGQRSDHWIRQGAVRRRPRATAIIEPPLILCGHGVSLNVQDDALVIRNGLTHFRQERETLRYFKGERTLPPRIIMLDGSGSLTFDVLTWLGEQSIPLIRVSWDGEATSISGGTATALQPEKVAWQTATYADQQRRLDFCRKLIVAKLAASLDTLRTAIPDTVARVRAIAMAEVQIDRLSAGAGDDTRDILTMEAQAAATYFAAWRGLPLRWLGLKSRPVPIPWYSVRVRRSDKYSLTRAINRNATHPVNAMLNYAYAVAHSHIQIASVADGFDPRRGILHEARTDSFAWVLDLIEPMRPRIDAAILKFVAANSFTAKDFTIRSDGVCRLNPQLARRAAQIASEALALSSFGQLIEGLGLSL